jgi:P-type Ca2+ transporter type 2C
LKIGQSIAFTSFALMMIVAAFECRSETDTALTPDSFASSKMNWTAVGEFVVAVLTTQMEALRRILGTVELDMRQFAWALLPAVALLILWEVGKLVVRRRTGASSSA